MVFTLRSLVRVCAWVEVQLASAVPGAAIGRAGPFTSRTGGAAASAAWIVPWPALAARARAADHEALLIDLQSLPMDPTALSALAGFPRALLAWLVPAPAQAPQATQVLPLDDEMLQAILSSAVDSIRCYA